MSELPEYLEPIEIASPELQPINPNTAKLVEQLIGEPVAADTPQEYAASFVRAQFEALAVTQTVRRDKIPQRREQLAMYLSGESISHIAREFGVTAPAVGTPIGTFAERVHEKIAPPDKLRVAAAAVFAGKTVLQEVAAYDDPEVAELEQELLKEFDVDEAVELLDSEKADQPDTDVSEEKTDSEYAPDEDSFVLDEVDESDAPAQKVTTAGGTTDNVKDYLRNIGKIPLLNAEQEVELSKRIEAGLYATYLLDNPVKNVNGYTKADLLTIAEDGKRAKDHLLEANLRLVVSLAKRYTGRGMLFMDLISEGNIGLIRAVEKFDYTKGYKFSTYATWWIRQAITRSMADQAKTIRIPVHMVEVINKVARIKRQLVQDLGREPTIEEVAIEADIATDKLIEIEKYGKEPASLNTPIGQDGDTEFGETLVDTNAVDPLDQVVFNRLQQAIEELLDTFSEREAGVIKMRYGLVGNGKTMTLDEIGKVYGVTRERIRQIEGKVMAKLRHPSRSAALKEFLE